MSDTRINLFRTPPAGGETAKGEPVHCQRYDHGPKCKMLAAVECPHRPTCWLVLLLGGEQPLTVYMASLLIGCSTDAVRRYVRSGKLRPLKKITGMRNLFFNFAEVRRFREALERERGAKCNKQH